jgi:hypothetical protein
VHLEPGSLFDVVECAKRRGPRRVDVEMVFRCGLKEGARRTPAAIADKLSGAASVTVMKATDLR